MFAGRVQEDRQPRVTPDRRAGSPIGRSPEAELARIHFEAVEILGAGSASSVFVHELVHKNTQDKESGSGECEVTTVISWLGGGCGGHRWVLDKPAAEISTDNLQVVLQKSSGGCRHA